jgi:hypothetical protein
MKADKWGTMAEQARFGAGWKTARQRKADRDGRSGRCSDCRHGSTNVQLASRPVYCDFLDCATREGAICWHWQPRQPSAIVGR